MDFRPFRKLENATFEHHKGKKPFAIIKEIPERPGYIIKESTDRTWWGQGAEIFKNAEVIKKYIEKIASESGVSKHIPKTEIVIGQKDEDSDKAVFIVQEKIDGHSISTEEAKRVFKENPEGEIALAIKNIGNIVKAVIKIYIENFSDGISRFVEVGKDRNFIYGTSVLKPELPKTVYIVDFSPVYSAGPQFMITELNKFLEEYPMLRFMFNEEFKELEKLKDLNSKNPA